MEDKKATLKILEEIEKARKTLGRGEDIDISIDGLIDGQDLETTLTKEEFEEESKTMIDELRKLLDETFQNLQSDHEINISDISRVELLGDCTRIQIFKDVIGKKFQNQELRRTMHSTEFLAKGGTILAALKSGMISDDAFPVNQIDDSEPELSYDYQDEQIQMYKECEDKFTEYDASINEINQYRNEVESKGYFYMSKERKDL